MASNNVLKNIQRLISITNTGLAFSKDPFDQERYQDIRAILQDLVRETTDLNPQELSDLFRPTDHYDTPLIDVRAWIVKDGKLCLVKGQGEETWALPGGFGEVGYSPTENILKEIQEETGYSARVIRLLAVFDTNRYQLQSRQYVKLVFECELSAPTAWFRPTYLRWSYKTPLTRVKHGISLCRAPTPCCLTSPLAAGTHARPVLYLNQY